MARGMKKASTNGQARRTVALEPTAEEQFFTEAELWLLDAQDQLKNLRSAWGELDERLTSYIRENPKQAALIAVGIGMAIGTAMSRKGET